MDAYLEFLNENAQRSYPFAEDSQPASGGYALPANAILDASGYSLIPATSVSLVHYSGRYSGVTGDFAPSGDYSTLFFQLKKGSSFFNIPVPIINTGTGSRNHGHLLMPGDSSQSAAAIVLTMGEMGFGDSAEYDFGNTAPFEASLVFDLSGSQVGLLEVVRQDVADYVVHGDVRVRGGYNMDVTQSGQTITLQAAVGGGELGRYEESVGTSPCSGLILSVSGARPNSRGEFKFVGGNRVVIVDHPITHTIDIVATVPSPSQPSCSA